MAGALDDERAHQGRAAVELRWENHLGSEGARGCGWAIRGVEGAVGGYVLVRAADFEEAMAIAGEWPLLDYDATVEVRPVRVQCPAMVESGMKLYPING